MIDFKKRKRKESIGFKIKRIEWTEYATPSIPMPWR